MKRIPLTQGQFALVDDEDFERINAHKWQAAWDEDTRSFRAQRIVSLGGGKRRNIRMHREVMGAGPGEEVDHIHHDTLDNRKSELRVCLPSDNQHNSVMQRNNTSGFKGVTWSKELKKWRAYIQVLGKRKALGAFREATDAARAYDNAAVEYHGEFALTNAALGLLP